VKPSNQPVRPLGLAPSFGFGDRLGCATPGHVAALLHAGRGIAPIFAQQSIREMTRTGRSPQQVMDDALRGAAEAGFSGPTGADADHLKTPDDVDRTAAAGFCFFTIDPSDHVDGQADSYDRDTLGQKARTAGDETGWVLAYQNRRIDLPTGTTITIDQPVAARAAVKYGRAVNHAVALSRHIADVNRRLGRDYEIELSIDETPQPTTLAEHFIIADHCLREGMKLVSLAPRFIGDFEKGIDYKGDPSTSSGQALAEFERSLADHAALARMLGPYKLSLHSGSDKLSIYPAFARATNGLFHVKTAGTSYLEAMRVVAKHDSALFRQIIDFARQCYERDRATYHVSAGLEAVPPPAQLKTAADLEDCYLQRWEKTPPGQGFTAPGRQILHTTYGSVLTHPVLGPQLTAVVRENGPTYLQILDEHFARHLSALRAGL
jgi:hypothetical protein